MNLRFIIQFFFNHISFRDWFKIIFNYFLIFLNLILEVLFITLVFLILNQKQQTLSNTILEQFLVRFKLLFVIDNIIELYILLLIVTLVLKNLIYIFQNYFFFTVIYNLVGKKAVDLFNFQLRSDYEFFIKNNTSTYIKYILRDNENIFNGILGSLLSAFGEFIYIFFVIIFSLSLISLVITYEEILLIIFILLTILLLLKLSSKYGKIRSDNEKFSFKLLNESFSIFKEIKLKDKSKDFAKKFSEYINKYYKSKAISGVINISPKILFEFGLLLFFYFNFVNSNLNINDYISKFSILALMALRILPSFNRLSSNLSGIFYNLESFRLIYKDLNRAITQPQSISNNRFNIILKRIKLKNISHKFINDDKVINVLKNFSYEFKIGNIYAIYGRSGLGKTTLLNIISGLVLPHKGVLYFNKSNYKSKKIYKIFKLSYLSQNPQIMDDNLISNLTLNLNFNNNQEDISRISLFLKKFKLNKFINSSFLKNESILSIKKLSGGEIQRISFIRAIFNNPDIILLDEPTAALDQTNERKLFSYLQSIKKNKIIIVTSHKNQLIKYFDKVINLEKVNAK
jgi:ABC-type bacteriocin/lantibiotic exporter with double-glycine peptidase domain